MKRFLYFWYDVFDNFGGHRCTLVAAALSYYALLSIVPITMLVIATLGYVLGSDEEAQARTIEYLGQVVPVPQAQSLLSGAVQGIITSRGVVTRIGVLVLLWTGSQLFMTLQAALNVVWNVETPRNWVLRRLVSIAATISLGFMALLAVGVNAVSAAAQRVGDELLATVGLSSLPSVWRVGAAFAAVVLVFLLFLFVYRLLPSVRVRWREAALAGGIACVLWLAAKEGFAWYIAEVARASINRFYGSLGGVVMVALWGFYSALVILFAAEVAAQFGRAYLGAGATANPPAEAATPPDGA